ncbi:hypothetical protein ACIA98_16270 [Streptomyces sp. NPDC051366]|uniref:hypothetical protein n=1 Tax=Streptomyces sp. NPDC051366 TaxID=3365652 RepID=UPI003788C7EB
MTLARREITSMRQDSAHTHLRETRRHRAAEDTVRVGAKVRETATWIRRTTADAGRPAQDAVPAMVRAKAGDTDAVARDLEFLLLAGAVLLVGVVVVVRRRGGL